MKKIVISLAFSFLLFFAASKINTVFAVTRTWDGGGGGDTSWDNCTNWSGDTCPGSADAVVFDGTSTNPSTVIVGTNFLGTINTLAINSGYTATITQNNTLTLNSTFTQAAGTFSVSNQLLTVGGNATISGGTFNGSSGTVDLNGTSSTLGLQITGGIFTAPSNLLTINGGLTISGTPTFNANGGTFTIDGNSTATFSCNNVTFNLVTFNNTNTKTISSNCVLPLGANPTTSPASGAGSITLAGTLSGSGTLTRPSGSWTLNSGATFTGFNGLSGTVFTIGGATLDFSTYTTFTMTGTFSISSGSVTLPSGATLSPLTISGGTFNAPSGTLNVSAALTISGTPIFNANGGTLNFNGTSGNSTQACNNVTFNLVVFSNSGGTKTINSDCNLPLGNNPTLSRGVTLNGTLSGSGTLTWSAVTFTLNSGYVLSGFSNLSGVILTNNGATADFTNYSSIFLTQGFNLSSGTFMAPSLLTVGTTFNHTGGTFIPNSGTVSMKPVGADRTISGSTTFYNLDLEGQGQGNRTITFDAGSTHTITGAFTALSLGTRTLSLKSSVPGTQWNINAQGSRLLKNLVVQDSNNVNSNIMLTQNSIDSGDNINWFFGSSTPISFFLDYPGGNSHITDRNPIYRWKKGIDNNGSSVYKYQLYLQPKDDNENNVGTAYFIDNIVPNVAEVNSNNKTLYYYNYSIYDDGDFLNLSIYPMYYTLNLGKYNYRVVAYDSAGNVVENNVDFYLDNPVVIVNTTQNNYSQNFPVEDLTNSNLSPDEPPSTPVSNSITPTSEIKPTLSNSKFPFILGGIIVFVILVFTGLLIRKYVRL